ncbi:MAG: cytochrome c oxidase assembly protein [Acidiphilium sp.]|nr:cytochrome c oxidase assembly protein [Acidiphilium sp.]MDD4936833.1 cytochrome c oxidase assembly protein [Acidiphilium sp.]
MNDTAHRFDTTDRRAISAIVAAGVLLDLACRFLPADLPYLAPFIFNAPIFAGTLVFAFWYGRGLRRMPRAARPALWRRISYFTGVAAIYFVAQTHFEYAAQHMFFLNRLQQMTLGVFAPFLVAFAWPRDVLACGVPAEAIAFARHRALRRPLAILRNPIVAAAISIAVTDVWLLPAVDFASMINPPLYAAMNVAMILSGLLFWLVVLDPRPRAQAGYSYLTRMATGFLTMFPQILVAATVALSATNFYDFYDLCGRLYPSISPSQDQLIGGMIEWIPPGLLNTAVLFVLLNAIRKNEETETRETPIPPGARVIEAKWTGR